MRPGAGARARGGGRGGLRVSAGGAGIGHLLCCGRGGLRVSAGKKDTRLDRSGAEALPLVRDVPVDLGGGASDDQPNPTGRGLVGLVDSAAVSGEGDSEARSRTKIKMKTRAQVSKSRVEGESSLLETAPRRGRARSGGAEHRAQRHAGRERASPANETSAWPTATSAVHRRRARGASLSGVPRPRRSRGAERHMPRGPSHAMRPAARALIKPWPRGAWCCRHCTECRAHARAPAVCPLPSALVVCDPLTPCARRAATKSQAISRSRRSRARRTSP